MHTTRAKSCVHTITERPKSSRVDVYRRSAEDWPRTMSHAARGCWIYCEKIYITSSTWLRSTMPEQRQGRRGSLQFGKFHLIFNEITKDVGLNLTRWARINEAAVTMLLSPVCRVLMIFQVKGRTLEMMWSHRIQQSGCLTAFFLDTLIKIPIFFQLLWTHLISSASCLNVS